VSAPAFVAGLDLGRAADFSAWAVLERADEGGEARYDLRHVDRVRGHRYPAIVAHTKDLVATLRAREPRPELALVLDYTGCGRPVADMFVDAGIGVPLVLVTITGGDAVQRGEAGEWRVPKRDLASVVQVVLQAGRLRIADGLPHARTLTEELTGFRVKIGLSGHDSYGAGEDWRSAPHDDLVLSLALALWWGERRLTGRLMA